MSDREDKDRAYHRAVARQRSLEELQAEQRKAEAERPPLYQHIADRRIAAEQAQIKANVANRSVAGHDRRQEEEDMIERSRRQTRRMSWR